MSHVFAVAIAIVLAAFAPSAAEEKTTGEAAAAAAKPAADATPKPRVIRYGDDKLTLHLEKVPVREVLDEIARQSGAEIRGDIPADAVVSARFENLSTSDALERVYGRKNFTLGYNDKGQLLRITLLGPPLTPEQAAAVVARSEGKPWPFDDDVRRSAEKVWGFFGAATEYPVNGRLAEALGKDRATFRDLAFAAARDKDPRVRSAGLKASLAAINSDREVRDAFVVAINDLPDDALAHLARQFAQEQAEEFVKQVARRSGERDLRSRVSPVLDHLDEIGPEK
jgi:hypothetical protein